MKKSKLFCTFLSLIVFVLVTLPALAGIDFNFTLSLPTSTKADGTTSATATRTGITGGFLHPTHISGHTDATSMIQIITGTSTVIWETQTGAGGFDVTFDGGVFATTGANLKAKIVTCTSACSITMESGFRR